MLGYFVTLKGYENQMTDSETWGNVVGTEVQVIIAEILLILYRGKYRTKMSF